jgi:hypothetical protein
MLSVFPPEIKSWGIITAKLVILSEFPGQNNKFCLFLVNRGAIQIDGGYPHHFQTMDGRINPPSPIV